MKVKLDSGAYAPTRAHSTDAGLDIRTPFGFTVYAQSSIEIPTGVHIELPPGTVGMIKSKSGLAMRHSIATEGVVDEGYSGEIVLKIYNHGLSSVFFERGDKVAQLCVMPVLYVPVEIVDEITEGERGESGFGSTGR